MVINKSIMIPFKDFIEIQENADRPQMYVVVKNNKVELRKLGGGSATATFGAGAVFAVLTGDLIQVNLQNGKTVFYKLSSSGTGVSVPYIK